MVELIGDIIKIEVIDDKTIITIQNEKSSSVFNAYRNIVIDILDSYHQIDMIQHILFEKMEEAGIPRGEHYYILERLHDSRTIICMQRRRGIKNTGGLFYRLARYERISYMNNKVSKNRNFYLTPMIYRS